MAGTLRGSIEHSISNTLQAGSRDGWVYLYNFLSNHPNTTTVASQYGASASGFDLTGGSNPAGENAFAVFSFDDAANPWYVLIQWSYNSSVNTSPGNPGSSNNSFGLNIAFAAGSGGGNPWNGGINADGTDTKGATVWTAPSGEDLLVWPRANCVGGSYDDNKQRMFQCRHYSNGSGRWSILADDDFLLLLSDGGDTGGYDRVTYFGPYSTDSNLTIAVPLVCIHDDLSAGSLNISGVFGDPTGSGTEQGGISTSNTADEVRTCYIDRLQNALSSTMQPTPDGTTYTAFPIAVRTEDTKSPVSDTGLLGNVTTIKEVANVSTHDTNSGKTYAVFGSTTQAHVKIWAPWDGSTTPGSGATAAGVQFP
jgi:hypothetical protein